MPKKNFAALTGIRTIAVFMVYYSHYPFGGDLPLLVSLQQEMHIGVTVFFVLSGFLITYRYFDNSEFNLKWISRYLINRFVRIYPIYFILIVPSILLLSSSDNLNSLSYWILNLSLFKGFFFNSRFWGIPQSWSLTVEFCFYFSAPFIFLLLKKFKNTFKTMALLTTTSVLFLTLFSSVDFSGFLNPPKFYLLYTFGGRLFEFIVGIIYWVLTDLGVKNNLVFFILLIIISVFLHTFVENPISRYIRNRFKLE